MKTKRLLRILSLLAFLLLFAPFYDSCSKKDEEVSVEATNSNDTTSKEKTISIFDIEPFNAFEIASLSYLAIKESTLQEIMLETSKAFKQKDWYKDLGLLISVIFDFIIVISFSLIIISFTKKEILFNRLALSNCILILTTLIYIIFLEKSFVHLRQIKWGYYSFFIANLTIFYLSKKSVKQT